MICLFSVASMSSRIASLPSSTPGMPREAKKFNLPQVPVTMINGPARSKNLRHIKSFCFHLGLGTSMQTRVANLNPIRYFSPSFTLLLHSMLFRHFLPLSYIMSGIKFATLATSRVSLITFFKPISKIQQKW